MGWVDGIGVECTFIYAFEAIDFAIWFHPPHVISIFTVQEKISLNIFHDQARAWFPFFVRKLLTYVEPKLSAFHVSYPLKKCPYKSMMYVFIVGQ